MGSKLKLPEKITSSTYKGSPNKDIKKSILLAFYPKICPFKSVSTNFDIPSPDNISVQIDLTYM